MYAYCNNNPVMYVDYSGESADAVLLGGKINMAMFGFRFQLALREHILVDIGMFKVPVVDISMFFREAKE